MWSKATRYFRSAEEPPDSATPSWWSGDYQQALEVEQSALPSRPNTETPSYGSAPVFGWAKSTMPWESILAQ